MDFHTFCKLLCVGPSDKVLRSPPQPPPAVPLPDVLSKCIMHLPRSFAPAPPEKRKDMNRNQRDKLILKHAHFCAHLTAEATNLASSSKAASSWAVMGAAVAATAGEVTPDVEELEEDLKLAIMVSRAA